jgi:16S rRNA G1207 methylase RsmC
MQNTNDIITMQDTSTQAMTEVALGLSMAFFALLIIALMSVALPPNTQADAVKISKTASSAAKIDVSNQVELSIQTTSKNKQAAVSSDNAAKQEHTILLYWGGQYFDTQQQLISIDEVLSKQNLIVAVSPQIPFKHLITIQTQFAGKQMRLTTLSEQWQNSLSEFVKGAP